MLTAQLCFNDKFKADSMAFVNGKLVTAAKTMQSFDLPSGAADAVSQIRLAEPSVSEREVSAL